MREKKRSSVSLVDQAAAVSSSQRPLRRLSLFVKATPFISKPKPLPKLFSFFLIRVHVFASNQRKRVKSCMQYKPKAKQATHSKTEHDKYNREKKKNNI